MKQMKTRWKKTTIISWTFFCIIAGFAAATLLDPISAPEAQPNPGIPNGPLSGGSITNYSTEPQRRVDMTFGIGYSDDIHKTKEVLKAINDDYTKATKVGTTKTAKNAKKKPAKREIKHT